ncbi:single-stranded DNA-binding protein [[Clostridium] sordellii]|uniref:Single-stranded DNA-binding protein n=1 Tax=Paraclostridium sordellii TaxID=1505 RepID=A0ABM9RK96_PARSO|nr:single-stranded DNA-binding protein [Paeniclostridium sordellii]CEJ72373.1 Single-stranded DNA-binding protein [[Clostridium] sordellii] [Paeniclostridium sordellii]CEN70599.1 single-stranded DNA-binding protein [[Clostridium] sordellii] [Paeniclostridium sordellii]CEN73904.1 single-stranded DNA-binding protein [[Clostridium] sordellii] [Paeniclostridium sordellii]CEO28536.1 single-stranded DNA-binding protein [[Clostridium] sordellii] [Paeniclostridium sordellii]CEP77193.1 single-stranded 
MMNLKEDTNIVNLRGELGEELAFSHEIFGEKFYSAKIKIHRLSDTYDILPITISERLLQEIDLNKNNLVDVVGQLRSYNKNIDNRNKLVLTVFARELNLVKEEAKDPNSIFLDGYICKDPIYRKTPLGREITDLLVAINRPYNKSDYIPSIVWGRNAKFAKNLEVGDRIQMWGRVQSRDYEKKLEDGTIEKRVAYEVSISKIKKLDENNIN